MHTAWPAPPAQLLAREGGRAWSGGMPHRPLALLQAEHQGDARYQAKEVKGMEEKNQRRSPCSLCRHCCGYAVSGCGGGA
eukprot:1158101-Pelagomonas_calceolata.AAC.3